MYDQDLLKSLSDTAKEKLTNQQDLYSELYEDEDNNQESVVYEKQDEIEEYMKPVKKINAVKDEYEHDINSSSYKETKTGSLDEIYPNGPSLSDIEVWKKQYPTCLVFAVEVSGINFVCRTITRPEYKKLISLYDLDQLQREEVICTTCILDPKNIEWDEVMNLYGGIPSTLATIIMEHSGFTNNYGVYIL